ncbi:ABC transporter permease [Paenibacillus lemnae]|uniref:Iron ABC transporter permease n=1 Tax=Paenibacillus lemnae TaxID=1330551 RepID=A0A848M7Z1_PAELE|nr:iron ABC transporter permease [Paenibacillus lemnae]NMO96003.1 iron ABC transporter permease [Paenibacillus lemnae]
MSFRQIKAYIKRNLNGWWIVSILGAAVILLPILFVFLSIFETPSEHWAHIKEYLVKDYVIETLTLTFITAITTTLLGVSLAWFVTVFDFPGRKILRWALVLPLAVPPYIGAYTYSTMFSYTGVVQVTLRNWGFHPSQDWISLTSMRGAVVVFTLFLYPYVYLVTRSFLERQSASYIENARLLGRNGMSIFFWVAMPICRPAIVGGLSLVVFEVLSDYGVTQYFGLQTVTTAIFKTWFGMYDVNSAMRLAAWLMVILAGFFLIERVLRRHRKYSASTSKSKPLQPIKLGSVKGTAVLLFGMVVLAAAFAVPILQLIVWATWTYQDVWNDQFMFFIGRTLYTAAVSTVIIMLLSLIVGSATRSRSWGSALLSRTVIAGYSIPGAIIAIGVLGVFLSLDQVYGEVYRLLGGKGTPVVLSLTAAMLIFGYVIRFMATGYNAVEVGFEKTGTRYSEASRLLGRSRLYTFWRVDLPLIKGAVLSGCILTFVEICKELPLALLLRPFDFETLSTRTYQYANNEQIHEAAIPSLLIIGISFISVYVLHYLDKRWET